MLRVLFFLIILTTTVKAEVISMLACNSKTASNSNVKYIDYIINLKSKNLTIHTHYNKIDDINRARAVKHKNLFKIDGNKVERNYKIKGGNIEDGIITETAPLVDADGQIRSQSSSYILYPKKSGAQWKYYVDGVFREDHSMKIGWTDCERVVFN